MPGGKEARNPRTRLIGSRRGRLRFDDCPPLFTQMRNCAKRLTGKPTCSAYHFFMVVVTIRYRTTAAARWALLFIVRTFFNDTFTVAVWTSFHTCLMWS